MHFLLAAIWGSKSIRVQVKPQESHPDALDIPEIPKMPGRGMLGCFHYTLLSISDGHSCDLRRIDSFNPTDKSTPNHRLRTGE
jgi:hypothetical protein